MDRITAFAFDYPKEAAMLGKAFVGKRAEMLFEAGTAKELWQLLFGDEPPALPTAVLTAKMTERMKNSIVDDFVSLLAAFSSLDAISIALLRGIECQNVKAVLSVVHTGRLDAPKITNIRRFATINYEKWPHLDEMLAETPFQWIADDAAHVLTSPLRETFVRIDQWHCRQIFDGLKKSASPSDLKKYFIEKFSMQNALWTLRMRYFYKQRSSQILPALVRSKTGDDDPLIQASISAMERSLTDFDEWRGWHYSSLLNDGEGDPRWTLSPMSFERRMHEKLQNSVRKLFHANPCSPAMHVAWFELKQAEFQNVCIAANALNFGIDAKAALN